MSKSPKSTYSGLGAATYAGVACLLLFLALTLVVNARLLWNSDLSTMIALKGPDLQGLVMWATLNGVIFAGEASIVLGLVVAVLMWRTGAGLRSLSPMAFLIATAVEATMKRIVDQPASPLKEFHRDYIYPFTSFDLGGAFPSGHASRTSFFFVFLAVWLWYHFPHQRALSAIACAVLILAVGVSRIYIGDHWPSDVVGGWLLGGGIALLVAPRVFWRP